MKPKVKNMDQENTGRHFLFERDVPLQEQFIRQVKDDSLPADRVLTEQKEDRTSDNKSALFVP